MIKNKKRQSDNFIFSLKKHSMDINNARKQIEKIYVDPHREWIDKIILIDEKRIISIYKKMRCHSAKAE